MLTGIFSPKGQAGTEKDIRCSRYRIKDKRVLGATQFPIQDQGMEEDLLKQPSFHIGTCGQGATGTDLGPQEPGRLISHRLSVNIRALKEGLFYLPVASLERPQVSKDIENGEWGATVSKCKGSLSPSVSTEPS